MFSWLLPYFEITLDGQAKEISNALTNTRLQLVITKGYGVRTTTKVKKLLLQRYALRWSALTDGQNTRDQIARRKEDRNARDRIAFYAFHSFLAELQTNAGYIRATHA